MAVPSAVPATTWAVKPLPAEPPTLFPLKPGGTAEKVQRMAVTVVPVGIVNFLKAVPGVPVTVV